MVIKNNGLGATCLGSNASSAYNPCALRRFKWVNSHQVFRKMPVILQYMPKKKFKDPMLPSQRADHDFVLVLREHLVLSNEGCGADTWICNHAASNIQGCPNSIGLLQCWGTRGSNLPFILNGIFQHMPDLCILHPPQKFSKVEGVFSQDYPFALLSSHKSEQNIPCICGF